jgi:hypothetical protein
MKLHQICPLTMHNVKKYAKVITMETYIFQRMNHKTTVFLRRTVVYSETTL